MFVPGPTCPGQRPTRPRRLYLRRGAAATPDCLPWCPDADLTGANLVGTKLLHANFPDAILSRTLH